MRVTPVLLSLLALSAAFTLAACSGADLPRDTTGLNCAPAGATTPVTCTLPLPAGSSFKITMQSTSCVAINDEIDLTSPETSTLTTDACHTAVPAVYTFTTTYSAASQIDIQFHSDRVANMPGTHVVQVTTGANASWTVNFEDGGDQDFNDVVLLVEIVPPA
jgi:hypothetical protein